MYFARFVIIVNKFRHSNPWRSGVVVIASAYRTEDPGFESHQGVRFLGLYTGIALLLSKLNCHCVYLRKINTSKNFENKKESQIDLLVDHECGPRQTIQDTIIIFNEH
jgi:hypothetical protein